jgi:hypothetical protein
MQIPISKQVCERFVVGHSLFWPIKMRRKNRFKNALIFISKINATPSYLLPKVSAFCHETLKSMLRFKSTGNSATIDSLMDVDLDVSKPNGHFEMNGYQNGISSDEEDTERTTSVQKTNLVVKSNNEKKKLDESLMHCFKLEDFLINSLK